MSRGLGKRQTAILELLTRAADRADRLRRGELPNDPLRSGPVRATNGREVTAADGWMFVNAGGNGVEPTRSEQEANRRALRTLEARGLIEVELLPRRPGLIGAMPAQLVARLLR
jgi:hypothetical protein